VANHDRAYRRDIQIRYSEEISEQVIPEGGLAEPVLNPVDCVRAEQRKITKVFLFLAGTSVVCLGALVLAPLPAVQAASSAIWAAALAFGWRLLGTTYRNDAY
jgi:hypothetical protein